MMGISIDPRLEAQSLPLCRRYVWVRFDAVEMYVWEARRQQVLQVHWALGGLADGQCELLGAWQQDSLPSMNWQVVFDELEARGVERIRFVFLSKQSMPPAAYPGGATLASMASLPKSGLDAPRDGMCGTIDGVGDMQDSSVSSPSVTELACAATDCLHVLTTTPAQSDTFEPHLQRFMASADAAAVKLQTGLTRAVRRQRCFKDRRSAVSFAAQALQRLDRRLSNVPTIPCGAPLRRAPRTVAGHGVGAPGV